MLNIFSFFKGYLLIKVSGFSVERFINLAMHRNIYLSDIKYSNSYVTMKVSIEGFRLLKPIAKKTKCNIKILKKCGLPFLMHRYRKRKILLAGVVFFLISIYILSTRIWLINVEGLERVYKDDLMLFVKNEGLYISSGRNNIDKEKIKEDILNNFDDIAWVNINIKGTKATISVKETITKKELEVDDTPSNIIAKKDGIIEQIVVKTGSAVVKPYDVVKKGDILIQGTLIVKEDEFGVLKSYVPSSGEVLAKTYYKFNFTIPFDYEENEPTGRKYINKRYNVFGKSFDLFGQKNKFESYNRISVYKALNLGEDYPLPFITITDTYNEIKLVTKHRSLEQAKILALKVADNKILKELAFDVNIVDKKVDLSENKNGIDVSISINAIEDIVDFENLDLEKLKQEENKIDNSTVTQ